MFPLLSWEQVRGPAFKWLSKVLQDIQEKLSNTIHSEAFLDSPVKFNNANLSRQFGISKSILSHSISYFWQRAVWGWAGRSERDKKESAGTPWMPQWFHWKWSYRNGNAAIELIHTHTKKNPKMVCCECFLGKKTLNFTTSARKHLRFLRERARTSKKLICSPALPLTWSVTLSIWCIFTLDVAMTCWCPLFDSLRLFFNAMNNMTSDIDLVFSYMGSFSEKHSYGLQKHKW